MQGEKESNPARKNARNLLDDFIAEGRPRKLEILCILDHATGGECLKDEY